MPDNDDDLRNLVRRYRVTWETHHEMAVSGRSVSPVGYVVELSAVSDHAEHEAAVSCADCDEVEGALDRLTHAVGGSEVIDVAHGRRRIGTAHDMRPETSATVTVVHRDGDGANRPPDRGESERVAAIVDHLRSLGAQEKHWDEAAAGGAR